MKSIVLIAFPIIMIAVIGMLYNSLSNIQVGSGSCQFYACTISSYQGCQGTLCQLSNQNLQIFNPASPFTFLLQGKITDFFFGLFNTPPSYNFFSCIDCNPGQSCTQTSQGYLCNNIGTFSTSGQCNFPPIIMYDGNHPLNYTTYQGNNSLWNIYGAAAKINPGCIPTVLPGAGPYSMVVNAYCSIIKMGTAGNHYISCQPPASMSATNYFTGIFGFFAFIAGILLLIVGLGISFSASALASGISFGSNAQGSKLMQTFGIFVLAFGFIFSEFGNWLFILPYGLGFVLLSIFLLTGGIGLYWRSQSYD